MPKLEITKYPSIFDTPVEVIDLLATLNENPDLLKKQGNELQSWVEREWGVINDLISQQNFYRVIRPYNLRPKGIARSYEHPSGVFLHERELGKSYGRVQVDLNAGRHSLRLSPDSKGEHMISASFRAGLEDRSNLNRVYFKDSYVDTDVNGDPFVAERKFELTVKPSLNLRRMGEYEGF